MLSGLGVGVDETPTPKPESTLRRFTPRFEPFRLDADHSFDLAGTSTRHPRLRRLGRNY